MSDPYEASRMRTAERLERDLPADPQIQAEIRDWEEFLISRGVAAGDTGRPTE